MKSLIAYPHEIRNALANGRGQFRRIVKPQPEHGIGRCHWSGTGWAQLEENGVTCTCKAVKPPYQPGDLLWVRETCATYDAGKAVCYRTDWDQEWWDGLYPSLYKKRSPIHMPRWASRLTLRVTGVRVERLQEISEEDAIAEGLIDTGAGWAGVTQIKWENPVTAYEDLWESIHGKGSWAANPWVTVNEFEVVR